MSRDVIFSMNTGAGGGKDIIQDMAMPIVKKSAEAIADRASSISGSLTSKPIQFRVYTGIGSPNKRGGTRAVAEIVADDVYDEHRRYTGYAAVQKSKDAGRV